MKRLLYFFPLNPSDNNTGSCRRALGLLHYFRDRGYHLDFASQEDWGGWTPESMEKFNRLGLSDRLYILRRKPVKGNPVTYYFGYKIWNQLYRNRLGHPKGTIPNHVSLYLKNQFDRIVLGGRYDLILISYAYWADLLKHNSWRDKIPCILDTHDFLTEQHKEDPGFIREVAFEDEMNRLALFDRIWAIAPEERQMFAEALHREVDYIPAWIRQPASQTFPAEYDLIYVATDNPHNLRAAEWFFAQVRPLLPADLRILVIGTIVGRVKELNVQAEMIPYTDELDSYYRKSRVALCPMLSGTGVKIKVLEAMAFGLPIVCNPRGMDGLPVKTDNGCLATEAPSEFAGFIEALLRDPQFYAHQALQSHQTYLRFFSEASGYAGIDASIEKLTPMGSG